MHIIRVNFIPPVRDYEFGNRPPGLSIMSLWNVLVRKVFSGIFRQCYPHLQYTNVKSTNLQHCICRRAKGSSRLFFVHSGWLNRKLHNCFIFHENIRLLLRLSYFGLPSFIYIFSLLMSLGSPADPERHHSPPPIPFTWREGQAFFFQTPAVDFNFKRSA